MRYRALTSASLLLLVSLVSVRPSEPGYVGVERCRLCHRSIYQAWSRTAHQRAAEHVPEEEQARDCFGCHATGPDKLPGVQCEACHGPGGNYWPAEIMIDPAKAREAGLIDPTESICRRCHGSGLPDHSSQFSMPGPAELPQGVH